MPAGDAGMMPTGAAGYVIGRCPIGDAPGGNPVHPPALLHGNATAQPQRNDAWMLFPESSIPWLYNSNVDRVTGSCVAPAEDGVAPAAVASPHPSRMLAAPGSRMRMPAAIVLKSGVKPERWSGNIMKCCAAKRDASDHPYRA